MYILTGKPVVLLTGWTPGLNMGRQAFFGTHDAVVLPLTTLQTAEGSTKVCCLI